MEFDDRIPKLIAGYLRDNLTASQQQELFDWVNETEVNRLYFSKATDEKLLTEKFKHFNREDITPRLDKTLESIDHDSKPTSKSILLRMKRYAIAACLMLIASSLVFFLTRVSTKKEIAATNTTTTNNNDVQPGIEKAVLTLSDGTKITLDNTTNGTIAQQGNAVVMKEDGLLAYNLDQAKFQKEILYNTLTTARGEEFRSLVLSDGTKVWLNSVSSIRYPTSFIGDERNVEITGEAYFEVAKNPSKPFKVKANGIEVKVLGTHFNVNAYNDEPTTAVTLIEGAVELKNEDGTQLLKPNQQAKGSSIGKIELINDPNIDAAIAWKKGYFLFKSLTVPGLMRQIRRWYNVEIIYEGNIPQERFVGKISRNSNLSELIKALKAEGLNIVFENNKIIIRS
ncbi:MAG TPA: FecR domain-containing protein [Chitinophagaceae bacterium]